MIARALTGERSWLSEPEGKQLLAHYGVPVAPTHLATSPREAAARAAEIGGPVAIKVVSPEIVHKSDVGGVLLDLAGPARVEEAAAAMLDRVAPAEWRQFYNRQRPHSPLGGRSPIDRVCELLPKTPTGEQV